MTARRVPVLVVLALAIAALVLVDRSSTSSVSTGATETTSLMPVASRTGALSSAFYCAGGAATTGAIFDTTLAIANAGSTDAKVIVTVYPAALPGDAAGTAAVAALQPVRRPFVVGARTRADVHLADIQASPFAAALVETSAPDIAVERRVASADGTSTSSSPCASSPSNSWYLPTGTTTRDARELLAVFNPFPAAAVVDVSFQTSDGFRNPPELQGFPIPGGQLRMLDISAAAPRIEQLAGTVSVRTGRVVVDRLQSFDGSEPTHPLGLAATLGAPAPSPVWTFGTGEVADGLNETITLMNPSSTDVQAQLEIALDDPATNGAVDPIPVTIPARGYAQLPMRDQTRVPPGVEHSVTVRALGGGDVVAERVMTAAAPDSHRGYAPSIGSPLVASRWVLADGRAAPGQIGEYVMVVNPDQDAIARVRVTGLLDGNATPIDGLQDVEVPPGGRITLQLAQHISNDNLPVVVEADRSIVVERGLYAGKGKGISLAAGIPIPSSASLPPTAAASTTTTTGVPPPPSS
ncbi:MAG TPA: DUF5719 family protein [Acidimicrobiales bacterium]|nr:DUF5719 family protein [Acidimicrobiales bacterium]